MAVELADTQGSFTVPLWNAQTLTNERNGRVNVTPITGEDSGGAFLTSLEQNGRVQLRGEITAPRLTRAAGYASDATTALAEWLVEFESVVNGQQGEGFNLNRSYRNDSVIGVVTALSWSVRGGETLAADWNLEFLRGEGTGPYEAPSPDSVSPGGTTTIAGETPDGIREFQVEKSQPYEAFRRAFADSPAANDVFTNSGATRRVRAVGEVAGDVATRNAFDDSLTASIGQDESIDIYDAVTGRTISGAVDAYQATDDAGRFRLGDFSIEIVEGDTDV